MIERGQINYIVKGTIFKFIIFNLGINIEREKEEKWKNYSSNDELYGIIYLWYALTGINSMLINNYNNVT